MAGNFERARKTMIDTQLRPGSITDTRLITTMGDIPRERFVPEDRQSIAYADTEHPMPGSDRILAPAAQFARLVQLAEVKPSDIVLVVGCGTGYSAAVLANLASAVVGLENDADLVETANENLAKLDIGNAAILKGELADGIPSEAPFDVIVVEGTVDEVPQALLDQLKDGGRLVAAVSGTGAPAAQLFVKTGGEVAVRTSFSITLPRLAALRRPLQFAL